MTEQPTEDTPEADTLEVDTPEVKVPKAKAPKDAADAPKAKKVPPSAREKGKGRVTPKGTHQPGARSTRPPDRRTDAVTEDDHFGDGRPGQNDPHTGAPPTQRRTGTRGGR